MAESPDIRPGSWPEPARPATSGAVSPLRPIGGQAPRFGVAHELDLIQRQSVVGWGEPGLPVAPRPAARDARTTSRAMATVARDPGAWEQLRTWWACREQHPVDLWHRLLCRFGRHHMQGGRQIQVGGSVRNTERRCVWCRARPE